VLDMLDRKEPAPVKQRMLVSAQADDLGGGRGVAPADAHERNVMVRSCALDFDAGGWSWRWRRRSPPGGQHAGRTAGAPLRGVRWTELSSSKANREEQT
jgi:hypothetical protein